MFYFFVMLGRLARLNFAINKTLTPKNGNCPAGLEAKETFPLDKIEFMKNLLGWLLAGAFVFYLYVAAFQLGPAAEQLEVYANGPVRVPDLSLFNNPQELHDGFLTPLAPAGRAFYMQLSAVIDTWYPISYCLFLAVAILFMTKKAGFEAAKWHWMALLPALTLAADLLENHYLRVLTLAYPATDVGAFARYQLFWVLKFGSFLLGIVWVLVLGGIAIKKAYTRTPSKQKRT